MENGEVCFNHREPGKEDQPVPWSVCSADRNRVLETLFEFWEKPLSQIMAGLNGQRAVCWVAEPSTGVGISVSVKKESGCW